MEDFVKEGPQGNNVWVLPLGGLGEVGKNLTVIESSSEIIIIDAGIMFPPEDMPGVDYIIPDIRYLTMKKNKVKAVILTHGHEDHIGALPYIIPRVAAPVYGTKLTLELVRSKFSEKDLCFDADLNVIQPGQTITLETFKVGFFPVIHSISESVGIIVDTPSGRIIHSGDFKFDFELQEREIADLIKLAGVGEKQTRLLLSDSTNAEKSGFSLPESKVHKTIDALFSESKGRILVSSFASSIPRINAIINIAAKYGRKVCILGRGLETSVGIAQNLGYINAPAELFIEVEDLAEIPDAKLLMLATGSQGEPLSAISTIANNSHKWVKIRNGDTVILSATPIPGNEALVYKNINALIRLGAEVIYENPYSGKENFHVHTSGHACQEDLKMLISLIKPEYIMPVHGELRHLISHCRLVEQLDYDNSKILYTQNGMIIEMNESCIHHLTTIELYDIIIDGYGIGDVGRSVLRERIALAENGVCIISGYADIENKEFIQGPYINTKGLVYEKEAVQLLEDALNAAKSVFTANKINDTEELNIAVKSEVRKFFSRRTKRKPFVISTVLADLPEAQEFLPDEDYE